MSGSITPPVVLVVDDNPLDRRLACSALEKIGLATTQAANGREALNLLKKQERPAAVLTDLQMPEMDGLQLVDVIKENWAEVPVILMTGHGSEDTAFQALRRGAASYVPKQVLQSDLGQTVERVLQAAGADRRRQNFLCSFRELECVLELENDPTMVPQVVTYFQEVLLRMGVCDGNAKVRVGIALEEALLNAIYHGNLELSSDLRQDGSDTYQKLAARRRDEAPYAPRRVRIQAHLNGDRGRFVIRDEGPGFDVSKLPDPTDPENLLKLSGRGVLLIRMFMDEVAYNDRGNELTLALLRKTAAAAQ
jgi:CheY-like chemotaxis protein/anti-sigma regulatory factor (Ser/Thr protein kinase)